MSHLWQKRSHQNKSRKGNYFRLVVKIKPCIVSGINLSKIFRDDLLPALPSFCRCSATSLIESCSTLEVIMWGRPLLPFWCLSPCSAALQFLQKCSTAVWSTRLLAWKKISLPWTTAACLTLRFSWCSFINPGHLAETVMITSVPPDVKMMSSAFPPTILATFSLDWWIIALALAPRNKKDLYKNYFLRYNIVSWALRRKIRDKQHEEINLEFSFWFKWPHLLY